MTASHFVSVTIRTGVLGVILVMLALTGLLGLMQQGHFRAMSVQTDSMEPLIKAGDAVVVDQRKRQFQVGDIITFKVGSGIGVYDTHRIIAIDTYRGLVTTKGDNAPKADTPIGYAAIQGRAVRTIPKAGSLLNIMRRPIGLVALIYVPSVLIIVQEIRKMTQNVRRRTYRLGI